MLTTSRRLCSISCCRAAKSPAGHRPCERELLVGREQRVLADLVQVDLRDIVDDVGAEMPARLGQRQLPACSDPAPAASTSRRRPSAFAGRHAASVRGLDARGASRSASSRRAGARRHAGGGVSRAGSTGLPCRRISKCSLTWSVSVLPISAIFWPLRDLLPFLDEDVAVVRVRGQVGVVVLDDDELAVAAQAGCRA